ncbi:MAG: NHL repeat-containing protein [Anaeromyxobacteraceae bacterium]
MSPNVRASALLAAALALGPAAALADSTPFVFDRAVYQDEKEIAFKTPEGVACNDAGDVVLADSGNGRLVLFRHVGGSLSLGTELRPAGLTYPRRVQFDSKGNILVLDSKARKVLRFDARGAPLGAFEVKPGASAMQSLPTAFKVDSADNVYVVDAVAGRVVVFDKAGTITRQLELPKGTSAITDVHVDAGGIIFVVDGSQAAIWVADKAATAFKPFTSSMKDKMNFPAYMTGAKGRFFLVDQNGNGIVVLGADGAFQGRQLAIGWSDGYLYYPAQMCINAAGTAFVADRNNNRLQVFDTAR